MRALPLLMLALLAAPAHAGPATVRWAGAEVGYEPDTWRVTAGTGGAVFTCTGCAGGPQAFGTASPADGAAPCAATGGDHEAGPLLAGGEDRHGALGFAAFSRWSGCRALDAPILEACAVAGGTVYRLTTALSEGCNRQPPMPEARFLELLGGIRAAGARP